MAIELEEFDAAEYLDTDEARTVFMREAFSTGDAGHIAHALGIIARAKGMSDIARSTGLSRGTLYKAFKPGGNPTLDTVLKVSKELGVEINVAA